MVKLPDRVLLDGARVGFVTHCGAVRAENQDSLYVPDPDEVDVKGRGILVAVADGMGGHAGGALASATVVQTLAEYYQGQASGLPLDLLALSRIESAHHKLRELSRARESLKGMGTTLTAALVQGRTLELFHVGDSRAYLFRGGELSQVSRDHTLLARWAEQNPGRPPRNLGKNVLTRAVGVGDKVLEVDRATRALEPGDRLLLSSDGLHGVVAQADIAATLLVAKTPWEAARRLIDLALKANAPDNVTVVVVELSK
ncbi:MAG: serine/threonine-protein phosphatase [Candidatus Riflebacteria bacterium]|nr:serine/threonine-protein phosphatase [Candidatus Riflebacteria bacterium]